MKKHEEPAPIYLKWVDSANLFQDRWAAKDDLEEHDEETYCETIGFLVAENSHSLYIAGSLAPSEIGSVMQIPRVAVVERGSLLPMTLEVEDGEAHGQGPQGSPKVEVRWPRAVVSDPGQEPRG